MLRFPPVKNTSSQLEAHKRNSYTLKALQNKLQEIYCISLMAQSALWILNIMLFLRRYSFNRCSIGTPHQWVDPHYIADALHALPGTASRKGTPLSTFVSAIHTATFNHIPSVGRSVRGYTACVFKTFYFDSHTLHEVPSFPLSPTISKKKPHITVQRRN